MKMSLGIGVAIEIITVVIAAVVVSGVVTSANFTGINATVATYLSTLILLGGFVLAGMIGYGAVRR